MYNGPFYTQGGPGWEENGPFYTRGLCITARSTPRAPARTAGSLSNGPFNCLLIEVIAFAMLPTRPVSLVPAASLAACPSSPDSLSRRARSGRPHGALEFEFVGEP